MVSNNRGRLFFVDISGMAMEREFRGRKEEKKYMNLGALGALGGKK